MTCAAFCGKLFCLEILGRRSGMTVFHVQSMQEYLLLWTLIQNCKTSVVMYAVGLGADIDFYTPVLV